MARMKEPMKHITLAPVPDGTEIFALAEMARAHGTVLYIARDEMRMSRAAACLAFFFPEIEVLMLPAWDCIPYDRVSPSVIAVSRRIRCLSALAQGAGGREQGAKKNSVPCSLRLAPSIILTTANAAAQRVLPREVLAARSLAGRVGGEIDRARLTDFLARNGYNHGSTATEPGEFAVRGSIVDIIPAGEREGLRLDFFADLLETIRVFDPVTQLTKPGETRQEIALVPAGEALLDEDTIRRFRSRYRELFGAVIKADPLYEAVSSGRHYAGTEHWLPLFYEKLDTVFDYVPGAAVAMDHLAEEAHRERLTLIKESYAARKAAMEEGADGAYKPIPPDLLYLTEQEWSAALCARAVVQLHPYTLPEGAGVEQKNWRGVPDFAAEAVQKKASAFEGVGEFLGQGAGSREQGAGGREQGVGKNSAPCSLLPAPSRIALIACFSEGSRVRMEKMLGEYNIASVPVACAGDAIPRGAVGLAILPFDSGFIADGLILITEQDILGEKLFRTAARRKRTGHFLEEAQNLQEGELVVHREHGIGRFEKLEILTVQNISHDFLKIIYRDGDRLFVPVENSDLITRYGPADETVELDKLGGLAWQQRTAKLKSRIRVTAEELLQIAAARAMREGEVFRPGGSYEQFCARFPYTETEDQLRAIEEVLDDLASGKPMDRLICGDVGFGKTEVALRAAFAVASQRAVVGVQGSVRQESEAVAEQTLVARSALGSSASQEASRERTNNNNQIAVITPTTLLCRQHYENFARRFAGFSINVKMLSRMVHLKEQDEVKAGLASGEVDIIVGTHALLSGDVQFKNLSLVIVDEEQHFGVRQKERLKKLRAHTHVLTLTATPIPRTLQLSLAGIRDLSLIATPPVDRLAVRTYVMPYDGIVIREAILREHYRGGRTFYVCPRISDLEEMELKIKALVPEVKVISAHGKMPPDTLERIMQAFVDGQYDVLLSTTIIESGLDIPQANTLVVHRADRYGLSQLYQIRGRVGRSKVRAYAYLTLPGGKIPTVQAQKRLEVMQKLDTLGAGFSLASHDMDIRGFGNLLGDEQSGQVREVGVELYQHLLQEAIMQLRAVDRQMQNSPRIGGEGVGAKVAAPEEETIARVNLGIPVLIPENYVSDLPLRLGLYRRIAYLREEAEVEAMAAELVDRFGTIPAEVENLLATVALKRLCRQAGIAKLDAGTKGATIEFYKDAFAAPEKLLAYVSAHPAMFKLRPDHKLAVIGREWETPEKRLHGVREVVEAIAWIAQAGG